MQRGNMQLYCCYAVLFIHALMLLLSAYFWICEWYSKDNRYFSFFLSKPIKFFQKWTIIFSSIIFLIFLYVVFTSYNSSDNLTSSNPNRFFLTDSLSFWFNFIVAVISCVVSFHCKVYTDFENDKNEDNTTLYQTAKFYTLYHAFIITMYLVQISSNLIVLCIAMELTTLSSTLLVCHNRSEKSVEAAWKYVNICSIAIIFSLIGILLLLFIFVVPEDATLNITELINYSNELNEKKDIIFKISFLFIFIGFGTKAGLAPLHSWLPDSHAEAPSPISALLSGVLLKTSFYAILRFYQVISKHMEDMKFFNTMLLIAGFISIVIAVPFIIKKQENFKRILAYHSLNHMGIILFATGIATKFSLVAALLHSFYHALTKSLMFMAHGSALMACQGSSKKNSAMKPLLKMPIYGFMIALGGFALVGSPPFAIFTTEFTIFVEAAKELTFYGGGFLTAFYLISLVSIFGGLTNHIAEWIFIGQGANDGCSNEEVDNDDSNEEMKNQQFFNIIPLIFLFILIVFFGFWHLKNFDIILNKSCELLRIGL